MPNYEIDAVNKEVAVRLYGNAINEKYTTLLKENKNLTLEDCILLDAVQKNRSISSIDAKMLAEKGLVEGEYPDIFISEVISQKIGQLDSYVKSRGLKRQYYKDLVVTFLEKKKEGATRSEIDRLLLDLIPKSSKSPAVYIGRLLNEIKEKDNVIHFDHSYWCLNERK